MNLSAFGPPTNTKAPEQLKAANRTFAPKDFPPMRNSLYDWLELNGRIITDAFAPRIFVDVVRNEILFMFTQFCAQLFVPIIRLSDTLSISIACRKELMVSDQIAGSTAGPRRFLQAMKH